MAECVGLLSQAKNLGVLRADVEYETLRRYAKDFEESAVSEAIGAVDRLKDDAAPGVVMTALVQAPDEAMRKAETFRAAFRVFADETFRAAVSLIEQKLKLAGADADADPDAMLPAEARRLDFDLLAIAAAVGGGSTSIGQPAAEAAPPDCPQAPAPSSTRFAALGAALDRRSRVDTVAQQLKELEPIRAAVNEWAVVLPDLVAQYAKFAARPDATIDQEPDGEKVRKTVAAGRAKVATSPLEITCGRTFTNLLAAVTKVIDDYRNANDDAWRAWVERQTPRWDDAELTPFEQHPEYRQTVVDLRAKTTMLQRLKRDAARFGGDFDAVEETVAALRELLGRLPTEAPEEVKRFLASTNTRDGAPLGALTQTVVEWLQANNQFDKYRIRR
jgi:hypothetical protein